MGGRDRTGMIAMLLLSAIQTEPEEIVHDYLETVRRGDIRAAHAGRPNDESDLEAFCRRHGTTTEGAFRSALSSLELETLLDRSGISTVDRQALTSWRGTVGAERKHRPRTGVSASSPERIPRPATPETARESITPGTSRRRAE